MATVVIRVDEALKEAFTEAAEASDRNASQLLREFMRSYVRQQSRAGAHDSWFRSKVQEGLADTRPPLEHEQVVKRTRAVIDRIAAGKPRSAG